MRTVIDKSAAKDVSEETERIRYVRHLDKAFNSRKKPPEFARFLGRQPVCRNIYGETTAYIDSFVEAFGPPEKLKWRSMKLLYWNFVREDGAKGFSLIFASRITAKHKGEITVSLSTKSKLSRDWESFMVWVLGRIGTAENCEQTPQFANGAHFVVVSA